MQNFKIYTDDNNEAYISCQRGYYMNVDEYFDNDGGQTYRTSDIEGGLNYRTTEYSESAVYQWITNHT